MRIPALMLAGAVIALAWIDGAQAQTGATAASVSQQTAPAAPVAASAPASAAAPEAAAPAERVAAADVPAAASAEASAADDPVVCRKEVETGTLGRRQKICMTKSQWEQQRQATRKYLRSVNKSSAAQPGGETLGP